MATRKTPQTFGSAGSYVNSISGTSTIAVAVGDVLVLFPACSNASATAIASISDGLGNTYTKQIGKAAASGINSSLDIWTAVITTAGTPTWVVTGASGQYATMLCGVEIYSGMATTSITDGSPPFTIETGYVNSHTAGSLTTTNANDVAFIGTVNSSATETYSAPTGYNTVTSIANTGQYLSIGFTSAILSATGAQNPAIGTGGYDQGITIAIYLKQTVVATAPTTIPSYVNASKGDTQILISWNDDPATTATSYKVQRSTTLGGTYTTVGTPTATEYLDTSLTNTSTYYYKVIGTNSAGDGTASSIVNATATARPSTPADKWYSYGSPPLGYTQTQIRAFCVTHYNGWVGYLFTKTGASQAGLGAWRVKVPDQNDPITGLPNGTFSEGIGYGLFVTAYMSNWNNPMYDINAQKYFNGFLLYYKYYKNVNGLMNWRIASDGSVTGSGGATDGDVDAAVALLIMDKIYGSSGAINYLSEATTLINAISAYEFVPAANTYANFQTNGDQWGFTTDRYMADYFAPAWMRLFREATGDSRWNSIISVNYAIAVDYYYNNTGYGLVPDGSTRAGISNGYEAYKYGYNSVRRPFRLILDYLWFGEPRAYKSMYRLGADIKTRSSGNPATAYAEPLLDWSSNGGYTNQAFYSGYGLATLTNSSIADFAGTVANYMNTNVPNESAYFGASLGMLALLIMSGEALSFSTLIANDPSRGFLV